MDPATPHEHRSDNPLGATRFTEVSTPGTVTGEDGTTLAFSGRVRFLGDRLLRFQAKIDEVVIGPASTAPGKWEPHPFGAVLGGLMDARDLTAQEVARRCYRNAGQCSGLRAGGEGPGWEGRQARAVP